MRTGAGAWSTRSRTKFHGTQAFDHIMTGAIVSGEPCVRPALAARQTGRSVWGPGQDLSPKVSGFAERKDPFTGVEIYLIRQDCMSGRSNVLSRVSRRRWQRAPALTKIEARPPLHVREHQSPHASRPPFLSSDGLECKLAIPANKWRSLLQAVPSCIRSRESNLNVSSKKHRVSSTGAYH